MNRYPRLACRHPRWLGVLARPAFAASAAPPLHPGSAPDLEVTGKVPLSTGTTASAAAVSVRPVPSVVGTNLDLSLPRPGQ